MERLGCNQARQIAAHRTNRLGNRHVVVIQDDNQPRNRRAGIIHSLKGHTCAHCAIANNRNHISLYALQIAADSHAKAG